MTDSSSLTENYQGVFDDRLGFGQVPALLVVDFINAYTDPASPLYAPAVVTAVRETVPLLVRARERDVPVIYTRVVFHPSAVDGGLFVRKVPVLRRLVEGEPWAKIVDDMAPEASDVVLIKQYASAFFGTSLASMFVSLGVDTIIIAGCSTSGCVRATAVDAIQHGFRAVVPRECVGDRHAAPHHANLFDINAKYGDVVSVAEVLAYLSGLPKRGPIA
jgi:maleamate amidohydrolase